MTLKKAIEILDRWIDNKPVIPSSNLHIAARLGREALRHIKMDRELPHWPDHPLLPGETEE